jgi:hypothetical protein
MAANGGEMFCHHALMPGPFRAAFSAEENAYGSAPPEVGFKA